VAVLAVSRVQPIPRGGSRILVQANKISLKMVSSTASTVLAQDSEKVVWSLRSYLRGVVLFDDRYDIIKEHVIWIWSAVLCFRYHVSHLDCQLLESSSKIALLGSYGCYDGTFSLTINIHVTVSLHRVHVDLIYPILSATMLMTAAMISQFHNRRVQIKLYDFSNSLISYSKAIEPLYFRQIKTQQWNITELNIVIT